MCFGKMQSCENLRGPATATGTVYNVLVTRLQIIKDTFSKTASTSPKCLDYLKVLPSNSNHPQPPNPDYVFSMGCHESHQGIQAKEDREACSQTSRADPADSATIDYPQPVPTISINSEPTIGTGRLPTIPTEPVPAFRGLGSFSFAIKSDDASISSWRTTVFSPVPASRVAYRLVMLSLD
jgi:hypothetical protein